MACIPCDSFGNPVPQFGNMPTNFGQPVATLDNAHYMNPQVGGNNNLVYNQIGQYATTGILQFLQGYQRAQQTQQLQQQYQQYQQYTQPQQYGNISQYLQQQQTYQNIPPPQYTLGQQFQNNRPWFNQGQTGSNQFTRYITNQPGNYTTQTLQQQYQQQQTQQNLNLQQILNTGGNTSCPSNVMVI